MSGASEALAPTTIYDPSYGKTWTGPTPTVEESEQAWEEGSVARFKYWYVRVGAPGISKPEFVPNKPETKGVRFVDLTN